MEKFVEVLAPAGSYETLKAAIDAGADAVYVGGSRFGARAYAQNFTEEELLDAIDYVHLRGKKLYLTVNTLIKEKEFKELYSYLLPYYRQGLDAVIVQDMGVMEYVKKQFPKMDVHASTQMTVTNSISAEHLEENGVVRVVPARELSLEEVREIAKNTDLEIECFVHGALCYCYSGQCLLSSMIGGRSGNRGQCAQPCRLPYKVGGSKQAQDIMSLKDMCTIEHIPDLIEAGITSFKIEGRMKQPSYVAAVTAMYRKYTDLYLQNGRKGYKVSKADMDVLMQAYKRRGYCDGYYYRHNGKDMISFERPKKEEETQWSGVSEKRQEKINGKLILTPGKKAILLLEYKDIKLEINGDVVDKAQKQPMTEERLKKQMCKTGNTPFVFDVLEISLNGDVFVPIQSLNDLRRNALSLLEEKIKASFRREMPDELVEEKSEDFSASEPQRCSGKFSVSIESIEQFKAVVNSEYTDCIYVEDSICFSKYKNNVQYLPEINKYIELAKKNGKKVYFASTRIFRKEAVQVYRNIYQELSECFDGVLVRNLESLLFLKRNGYSKEIISDSNMYQWNTMAKKFWHQFGVTRTTAPVELNYHELRELGLENMELIIYGHLPVMISAGCVQKNTSGCTNMSSTLVLTDRYQKKFVVKNVCNYCYNVIYNTAPVMLVDQKREIETLNASKLRLQFTVEDEMQTKEMLEIYGKAFIKGIESDVPDIEFTRGHFKRGVK